mgnify:CR=1 FL=1
MASLICPHIAAVLVDEGDISVGQLRPAGQVAIASDPHQAIAIPRRRPDESFAETLKPLDAVLATAVECGKLADGINKPPGSTALTSWPSAAAYSTANSLNYSGAARL